jgi:hypothetical protein
MHAYLIEYPRYSSGFWGWQWGMQQFISDYETNRNTYDALYFDGDQFNAPWELQTFYTMAADPSACAACFALDLGYNGPTQVRNHYAPTQRALWVLPPRELTTSGLLRLPHRIVKRLYYPDGSVAWLYVATGPGIKAAVSHQETRPDRLPVPFTTAPPVDTSPPTPSDTPTPVPSVYVCSTRNGTATCVFVSPTASNTPTIIPSPTDTSIPTHTFTAINTPANTPNARQTEAINETSTAVANVTGTGTVVANDTGTAIAQQIATDVAGTVIANDTAAAGG